MNKLKAVIIGCGAIFPMHAVSIQTLDDVQIAAVCDIKEDRAKKRAEEYNCKAYTDYKKMIEIEKPDTVHVCLPHWLHAPVSIYAMEHGADVICEKPMALDEKQASDMLECAKKTNAKLSVIFQNRYNDVSAALKNEMDTGRPGKVLGARACVNWHRTQSYYDDSGWRGKLATEGGGVVVNQAIHTLDLMLYLSGEKAMKIDANISTRAHDIEVEDSAEGVVYFKNGALGSFWFTNYYPYDKQIEVEIKCENAVLQIFESKAYIKYNSGEVRVIEPVEDKNISYGNAKGYWGSSHKRQIADFYEYVKTGRKMYVTSEDAFETHKVMCALLRSGREKQVITIE